MRDNRTVSGDDGAQQGMEAMTELPLFPLNVVLFPGMVLPLHIFEPRYREMINYCVDEKKPFGVVLVEKGQEVGGTAVPHQIGTAARVMRVEREPDGRMDITTVGTQRFKIESLDHSHSYLKATVSQMPFINAGTRAADQLMHRIRPKVLEYVEVLAEASKSKIKLERVPQDPKTLAFLIAIALQVNNEDKQAILELPGIPDMLARESYLLSREVMLLEFMLATQENVNHMTGGPTGYVFPN